MFTCFLILNGDQNKGIPGPRWEMQENTMESWFVCVYVLIPPIEDVNMNTHHTTVDTPAIEDRPRFLLCLFVMLLKWGPRRLAGIGQFPVG